MFYTNVNMLGDYIFTKGYDENGDLIMNKEKFQPTLWIPASEQTPYKNIKNHFLKAKEFDSIKTARNYVRNHKDHVDIFGTTKYEISYIHEFFGDREVNFDLIRRANVDIEVYSPNGFPDPDKAACPINSICHYDNIDDKYYVFYLINERNDERWTPEKSNLSEDLLEKVEVDFYETEDELLKSYCRFFSDTNPDLFTGWNTDGFDIPYLVNRIENRIGKAHVKLLSPWRIVKEKQSRNNFGKEFTTYNILGVSSLDYMDVYKKQTFTNQEFYTLDHIAYVELKERKLDYAEAKSLHNLYNVDPVKFIDYNIKDVNLVERLERKKNLLRLVIDVAYFAGINYVDVASPIRTWEALIYNDIVPQGIIPPTSSGTHRKEAYPGGYVQVPQMGMWKWICSFDLTSLYPSIIRQWNISPDTILPQPTRIDIVDDILQGKKLFLQDDECIAGNNVKFSNGSQGFLARQIEKLFFERKSSKEKAAKCKAAGDVRGQSQWYTRQWALKVLLNSAYGAMASPYFCFYDINMAEAVTLTGQTVIKYSAQSVNEYLNNIMGTDNFDYCVYIDTDSNYFNFAPLVEKFIPNETDETKIIDFLDGVCKVVEAECLKPAYEKLCNNLQCREQVMNMDREVIASSGFWQNKKRYALKVWDDEGYRYDEPQLKIMGLEIVKKDTPEIVRNKLKELVGDILDDCTNDELINKIDEFKTSYVVNKDYHYNEISKVVSVNHIKKYEDSDGNPIKGTHINSRAAIVFNKLLEKHQLNIPKISQGDKIHMVPLREPNTIGSHILGYVDWIPEELDAEKWIDYLGSYEKTFETPMKGICDAIGWQIEQTSDIFDFF